MINISDIGAARNAVTNLRPSGSDTYVDRLQFWLKHPDPYLNLLAQQCGDRLFVFKQTSMPYNPEYILRCVLQQPRQEDLLFLSQLDGLSLNAVEFAHDLTWGDEFQRDEAHETLHRYHVKRQHRDQELTVYHRCPGALGTRYTAKRTRLAVGGKKWRRVANLFVTYADKPSRITGESYCLHLEWRVSGVQALKRIGVSSIKELLSYDHYKFWKQRLILKAIDIDKLGRFHNVKFVGKGRRRRKPWRDIRNGKIWFDFDRATGIVLLQRAGIEQGARATTQAVIDRYRSYIEVSECLVELEAEHWLPEIKRKRRKGETWMAESCSNSRKQSNDRQVLARTEECHVTGHVGPFIIGRRQPERNFEANAKWK